MKQASKLILDEALQLLKKISGGSYNFAPIQWKNYKHLMKDQHTKKAENKKACQKHRQCNSSILQGHLFYHHHLAVVSHFRTQQ